MALKALLCSGNDESPQHWSVLRAINTLNSPKKYTRLLGGLLPIHSMHRCGAQGLMWGTSGPFPPAAAMVGYGCVGWCWPLEAYVRSTYLGILKIVYGSIFLSLCRSHTFLTFDPAAKTPAVHGLEELFFAVLGSLIPFTLCVCIRVVLFCRFAAFHSWLLSAVGAQTETTWSWND